MLYTKLRDKWIPSGKVDWERTGSLGLEIEGKEERVMSKSIPQDALDEIVEIGQSTVDAVADLLNPFS